MTEHADVTGKEIDFLTRIGFGDAVDLVRHHVAESHRLGYGSVDGIVEDMRHLKAIFEGKLTVEQLQK